MTTREALQFLSIYLRSPLCNLAQFEREALQKGIEALQDKLQLEQGGKK